jgi:hypothetical protein
MFHQERWLPPEYTSISEQAILSDVIPVVFIGAPQLQTACTRRTLLIERKGDIR